MKETEHTKQLIKEKRIKQISEGNTEIYEIDNQTVIIKPLKGRRIITCTCLNHTRNCNQSALCRHKIAAIQYSIVKPLYREIEKLKSFYKATQNIVQKVNTEMVLEDLNKLK